MDGRPTGGLTNGRRLTVEKLNKNMKNMERCVQEVVKRRKATSVVRFDVTNDAFVNIHLPEDMVLRAVELRAYGASASTVSAVWFLADVPAGRKQQIASVECVDAATEVVDWEPYMALIGSGVTKGIQINKTGTINKAEIIFHLDGEAWEYVDVGESEFVGNQVAASLVKLRTDNIRTHLSDTDGLNPVIATGFTLRADMTLTSDLRICSATPNITRRVIGMFAFTEDGASGDTITINYRDKTGTNYIPTLTLNCTGGLVSQTSFPGDVDLVTGDPLDYLDGERLAIAHSGSATNVRVHLWIFYR